VETSQLAALRTERDETSIPLKTLGFDVPPSLLARADDVIE
jgi:hypothetical protein